MATFSWAVKRLRDFLAMGKPPLDIVAYSSGSFFPFRLKQNSCGTFVSQRAATGGRLKKAVASYHFLTLISFMAFFIGKGKGNGNPTGVLRNSQINEGILATVPTRYLLRSGEHRATGEAT
jgi:hypothetical protein